MTVQTINIGNVVNDGLGDDLRTAFQKVNANFSSLAAELTLTGINIGGTGAGVFKQKTGTELEFRKIKSSNAKITVDETVDSVVLTNNAPDAFVRFDTDSGSILASTHTQITLQGLHNALSPTRIKDIEVTTTGSNVYFKTILPVTDILTTYDFGPIVGTYASAVQLAMASSNIDFGTIDLPGRLDLDCGGII